MYAAPLTSGDFAQNQSLLPIRGIDLPVVNAVDAGTDVHEAPADPPVEAIPTPTAFQAGIVVLTILCIGRLYRKLRRA
jgi:hypothetical protein